jgi:hypothetical protein
MEGMHLITGTPLKPLAHLLPNTGTGEPGPRSSALHAAAAARHRLMGFRSESVEEQETTQHHHQQAIPPEIIRQYLLDNPDAAYGTHRGGNTNSKKSTQ